VAENVETVTRVTNLSWAHHREVAALEPVEQEAFLAKAVEHNWSTRDLKQAVRLFKTALRIGKHANEADDLADTGVYQVLYVDPPWQYEYAESSTRAIENNYPTMTLDEIKALEVPAAPDAVLFLWATSPKLSESIEVMEAWGFEYRTCMVWVKDQIGMGYYARQRHELLLIGKRGELPVPPPSDRPDSVVEAPRTEHSAKPERFAELIEDMYPDFSKAELFCRGEPRDGWFGWGNQAVNA
jgi:N6-adenosine-specific RNA methylase IME4